MDKTKFTAISIDTYTNELLNELCEVMRLSKAGYLRALIREEAAKRLGKGPAVTNPSSLLNSEDINEGLLQPTLFQTVTKRTSNFRMAKRNKDGKVETPLLSDFDLFRRLVSFYGLKTHQTIDKQKIKDAMRDTLVMMLDDLEEAPQEQ